jgi:hypothetical protein
MGLYLFALVMIVLNLAAFGIGMRGEEPVSTEVAGQSTAQRTRISARSALGASALRD